MEITGIILAGGKSTRMGADKGFMNLHGKSLIEHVMVVVKEITNSIIIIANNSEYRNFGFPVFSDIIKDSGPMGGIYAGLVHSQTQINLVVSCDIPFINSKILKLVINHSSDYDITVPLHSGKIEPLCAVYQKDCSSKFRELLLKKELKISQSYRYFRVKRLEISKEDFFSEVVFRNVNSKSDLFKAEELSHEN